MIITTNALDKDQIGSCNSDFFFFSTFGQNVIILKATWFSEVTLKGSMFITLIFIFRSAKLQSSSSMDLA